MERLPQLMDKELPLFPISVAAQLASMHPQTLRAYDRLGLVVPTRSRGRGRRYSLRDVARLRMIQYLSQEEGVNLNGVRRILELESTIDSLGRKIEELTTELRRAQAAPTNARLFTASPGGVQVGPVARRQSTPRAIER